MATSPRPFAGFEFLGFILVTAIPFGVYDLVEGAITMTGSVVLTQGCNVSTGERLTADLDGGVAQLSGGEGGRVRSVFFDDPDADQGPPPPGECPQPEIPGDGPQAFEPRD